MRHESAKIINTEWNKKYCHVTFVYYRAFRAFGFDGIVMEHFFLLTFWALFTFCSSFIHQWQWNLNCCIQLLAHLFKNISQHSSLSSMPAAQNIYMRHKARNDKVKFHLISKRFLFHPFNESILLLFFAIQFRCCVAMIEVNI